MVYTAAFLAIARSTSWGHIESDERDATKEPSFLLNRFLSRASPFVKGRLPETAWHLRDRELCDGDSYSVLVGAGREEE